MEAQATVILDVGKTHSKLTLWGRDRQCLDRRTRTNAKIRGPDYAQLDVGGVEVWLRETLISFANRAHIDAIIPVGHGAAAALLSNGQLHAPVMDYEDEPDDETHAAYAARRDRFWETGSPLLPAGLNLGMQLHRLEAMARSGWPDDLQIVTWPQYWAWRLCDVAASEVSSFGSHTDLWRPLTGAPSTLAEHAGWAARFAPLKPAGAVLGRVTPEWIARGLPGDCAVYCGLHDSNAALLAALGHPELADKDATVLSTGTWFVAMRSVGGIDAINTAALSADRDCLINVDVKGRPVPSARFMGGREAELLCGESLGIAIEADPETQIAQLRSLLSGEIMAIPTAVPGVGPFPSSRRRWTVTPLTTSARRAAVSLYLALMADVSLDLIGSRERLLIEGRFADDALFVRALAGLRPEQRVYTSHAQDDVCYGALRLIDPDLPPSVPLTRVEPLNLDLNAYRMRWRAEIAAWQTAGQE